MARTNNPHTENNTKTHKTPRRNIRSEKNYSFVFFGQQQPNIYTIMDMFVGTLSWSVYASLSTPWLGAPSCPSVRGRMALICTDILEPGNWEQYYIEITRKSPTSWNLGMDSSTIFQAPPQAAYFLWSCDKVYHKHEVCFLLHFLGQVVSWQYNPNLLDLNWPCTVINDHDWQLWNCPLVWYVHNPKPLIWITIDLTINIGVCPIVSK